MAENQLHVPKINLKQKKRYYARSLRKESLIKMYNSSGKLSHESPDTRIASDRKWFGNNKTISQEELASFQNAYREIKDDPYTVILHRKKLPTSLIVDKEENKKFSILKTEPFSETFGKNSKRTKPNFITPNLKTLLYQAEAQQAEFDSRQVEEEMKGHQVEMGQTKRVLSEVYKVIDSSDVIIEVLDARDPLGTRSKKTEEFIVKETPHKDLIFVLNKCDLIPKWAVEKAVKYLSKERPTIAFRAHLKHHFGREQLLGVLKQFQKLHQDRSHLCVGFIGYPNVGKSSIAIS
jgi:nuclear GTP-binding protein